MQVRKMTSHPAEYTRCTFHANGSFSCPIQQPQQKTSLIKEAFRGRRAPAQQNSPPASNPPLPQPPSTSAYPVIYSSPGNNMQTVTYTGNVAPGIEGSPITSRPSSKWG